MYVSLSSLSLDNNRNPKNTILCNLKDIFSLSFPPPPKDSSHVSTSLDSHDCAHTHTPKLMTRLLSAILCPLIYHLCRNRVVNVQSVMLTDLMARLHRLCVIIFTVPDPSTANVFMMLVEILPPPFLYEILLSSHPLPPYLLLPSAILTPSPSLPPSSSPLLSSHPLPNPSVLLSQWFSSLQTVKHLDKIITGECLFCSQVRHS